MGLRNVPTKQVQVCLAASLFPTAEAAVAHTLTHTYWGVGIGILGLGKAQKV